MGFTQATILKAEVEGLSSQNSSVAENDSLRAQGLTLHNRLRSSVLTRRPPLPTRPQAPFMTHQRLILPLELKAHQLR